MLEVYEPEFTEEDKAAVRVVLDSGWLNESKKTKEFERRFAEFVGTKYAVATTSGTAALFLALKAAGVDYSSIVAVPDCTAVGTVRAVQMTGALTILTEVDDWGNIDFDAAKDSGASHVIAVHNNGRPCAIEKLVNHFGRDYVIEDACQSIGSYLNSERHLGTIASLGCFSLATTKIVTSGQGGVVVTDDDEYYEYIQRYKNQGNFRGKDPPDTYPEIGFNLKWTEMEAALALSQMNRLHQRIKRMRELVELYYNGANIQVPPPNMLPWRITTRAPANKRDAIIKYMRERGVNAQPFPKPIHQHRNLGEFPRADKYASEGIYLPSSPTLTNEQVQHVCEVFKEAFFK